MPDIPQAWLALIGALLGGSGLKFIEHYLSKPKIKEDTATQFRNELREEMKTLKEELREAEKGLDEWKIKYFTLLEEFSRAKIERDEALHKIQEAADQSLHSEHTHGEKRKIQEARDIAARELREREG